MSSSNSSHRKLDRLLSQSTAKQFVEYVPSHMNMSSNVVRHNTKSNFEVFKEDLEHVRKLRAEKYAAQVANIPRLIIKRPGTTESTIEFTCSKAKHQPKKWIVCNCLVDKYHVYDKVPQLVLLDEDEKYKAAEAYRYHSDRDLRRQEIVEERCNKFITPYEDKNQEGVCIEIVLFNDERKHKYIVSVIFRSLNQFINKPQVWERFVNHQVQVVIQTIPYENLSSEQISETFDVPLRQFITIHSLTKFGFPFIDFGHSKTKDNEIAIEPGVCMIYMEPPKGVYKPSMCLIEFERNPPVNAYLWKRSAKKSLVKKGQKIEINWDDLFNHINQTIYNHTGIHKQCLKIEELDK